jgi:FlaA1/EpsC-like NDP-sugar epimerase
LLRDSLAERICIYSRGEYPQAKMRVEFADDQRLRWFIGDIRDSDRLTLACDGVDTVIHAAALKRVEACEANPGEAVATNIIGTENVIRACLQAGVERCVILSTDKACSPCTLYGSTKLTAERMTLAANVYARTKFSATRYGNVFGSSGSVVPTWQALIESGIVPVTNPDCTRFYMTLDEAIDLVLQTVESMPTTLAVPDLPAYRLGDLAEAMGVQMRVTGFQTQEKLHERMLEDGPDSSEVRRMSVAELRTALEAD